MAYPPPVASRALAIVGPTGSGKSTVALRLAEACGGEIVSCDSVQVYRDFVVGCAKPTLQERLRVPHHLLDLVDWHESFDAARYVKHARAALSDIEARGAIPIVCGGTGLYLRALRWGLVELPPRDPTTRARLEAEEREQPGVLYERLTVLDPETARRTEPHNLVHIIRALEIGELTGKPASVVREAHGFRDEEVPLEVVALRWPRDLLRRRIEARAAQMLTDGLLEEVQQLFAQGVSASCRPMRSVGYQETCDVVLGAAPRAGLEERIAVATWAYARRQVTWLRRERSVRWIDVEDLEKVYAALAR